jgi:hypothetical protein
MATSSLKAAIPGDAALVQVPSLAPAELRIGAWSAFALAVLAGFISAGTTSKPLQDPFLAIMELLIVLMVPFMVTMMAAVYARADVTTRPLALAAFAFMTLAAGTTAIVHVTLLTVGRQLPATAVASDAWFFSWDWPSVLYAADIVAWDLFLGLALVCAALSFNGGGLERALRVTWALSGGLCLVAMIGPAIGNISIRMIGVASYGVIFPLGCVLLGILMLRSTEKGRSDDRAEP